MSYRVRGGAWVIPVEQLKQFENRSMKLIYRECIEDALKSMRKQAFDRKCNPNKNKGIYQTTSNRTSHNASYKKY